MYFTGFADEAASDVDGQIRVTKALGWSHIESRQIEGGNIHDIADDDFDRVCARLDAAGVHINCFGSTIANWGKGVDEPFDASWEAALRAVPRMQRLGTRLIRIMSFKVMEDREPDDQMEAERFRRLRELVKLFGDAGIQAVHENCMNYGGMGWPFTLKLIENVPGLKLVFDTGNPPFSDARHEPKPYPKQSSWEFYEHVKPHVAYIHIKDGKWNPETDKIEWCYPGEGDGDVRRIIKDLLASGYDGGISIEPHMKAVFHESAELKDEDDAFKTYVEYGRRLMRIVEAAR